MFLTCREKIEEILNRLEKLPGLPAWGGDLPEPVVNKDDPQAMLRMALRVIPTVGWWQLAAANALAMAHHHGWALPWEVFHKVFPDREANVQIVDVLEAVLAHGEINSMGILIPTVECQRIVHTTGTGRLSWEIFWDNTLTFRVSRPAGTAFDAQIFNSPFWGVKIEEGGVPFHVYHVETVRNAVLALIDAGLIPEDILANEVWREILAKALPNPGPPPEETSIAVEDGEKDID